jgi:hypothetical protein
MSNWQWKIIFRLQAEFYEEATEDFRMKNYFSLASG